MTTGLVLASASPRRRDLLETAGYRFVVRAADVDERVGDDEAPVLAAARLATEKAQTVCRQVEPGAVVLGADTTVVCGRRMLGKPSDHRDAYEMLLSLAGRNHRVITCWTVAVAGDEDLTRAVAGTTISTVRMREVGMREAWAYANSAEPMDKAGAYAVQGEGRRFIAAVMGSLDNVIGLPVAQVSRALDGLGVRAGRV